ncbi:MAG: hypothetical protein DHS20C02_00600 [Micavibrio sp.]|nr:MAG: hypothetical protein DHS20C02_00600 [Micavibrio sp.]
MNDKEIFLRNKMYELHLFTVKLLVTFSSSALVFSIGMLSLLKENHITSGICILVFGWILVLISIILVVVGLFLGLELTYNYYNNIVKTKPEIDGSTSNKEGRIHTLIILSALSSIVSVVLILIFAYLNFL